MIPTSWPDFMENGGWLVERNKKTQGLESMKAPKSPTDMIIAPDVLSGALNAGRLSGVDVYLSL